MKSYSSHSNKEGSQSFNDLLDLFSGAGFKIEDAVNAVADFKYDFRLSRDINYLYLSAEIGPFKLTGHLQNCRSFYALVLVKKGHLVIRHGERTIDLKGNSLSIIDPSVESTVLLQEPTLFSVIYSNKENFEFRLGYSISKIINVSYPLISSLGICFIGVNKCVSKAIESAKEVEIDFLCGNLLSFAAPCIAEGRRRSNLNSFSRKDALRLRAEEVILKNISDPQLSLDKIAGETGVSGRYLSGLYSEIDTSVMERLKEKRLVLASQYLLEHRFRNTAVSDIAVKCGFKSLAHFSRSFKEKFGCSPVEWKKKSPHTSI